MKATELMIGDFIECVDSTHKNKVYAQVCAIEEGQTCILVEKDCSNWFLDISFLKPIQLTPKILEDNGFRITFEGELHKTYFQDIDGFAVEIKIDCIGFTKLSMSNGLGYKVVIECKHIHQLQHAFSLCGISKKIVL